VAIVTSTRRFELQILAALKMRPQSTSTGLDAICVLGRGAALSSALFDVVAANELPAWLI